MSHIERLSSRLYEKWLDEDSAAEDLLKSQSHRASSLLSSHAPLLPHCPPAPLPGSGAKIEGIEVRCPSDGELGMLYAWLKADEEEYERTGKGPNPAKYWTMAGR